MLPGTTRTQSNGHSAYPGGKRQRTVKRFTGIDAPNVATCSGCTVTGGALLVKTFCPRHDALAYSMHMARHAVDSFPL